MIETLPARKTGRLSEFIEDRNVGSDEQCAAFVFELYAMLVQAVFCEEKDFTVCSRLEFPKRPAGDSVPEVVLLLKSLLFWVVSLTAEDAGALVNIRFTWS